MPEMVALEVNRQTLTEEDWLTEIDRLAGRALTHWRDALLRCYNVGMTPHYALESITA